MKKGDNIALWIIAGVLGATFLLALVITLLVATNEWNIRQKEDERLLRKYPEFRDRPDMMERVRKQK